MGVRFSFNSRISSAILSAIVRPVCDPTIRLAIRLKFSIMTICIVIEMAHNSPTVSGWTF